MNRRNTPHMDHYEGLVRSNRTSPKTLGGVAVATAAMQEEPAFALHVSRSMRAQSEEEKQLFDVHPDMTPPIVRAYYQGRDIAQQSMSGEEPLHIREILANADRDSIYAAAAKGIRSLVLEDFAQSSE